jgi:hypothetical protein
VSSSSTGSSLYFLRTSNLESQTGWPMTLASRGASDGTRRRRGCAHEEVTRVHGAGELARVYPRYGYRRIQVFLERDGHAMSAGAGHAIKAPLLRSPGHSGAERAVARVLRQCRWGFAEKGSPGTVPMT